MQLENFSYAHAIEPLFLALFSLPFNLFHVGFIFPHFDAKSQDQNSPRVNNLFSKTL